MAHAQAEGEASAIDATAEPTVDATVLGPGNAESSSGVRDISLEEPSPASSANASNSISVGAPAAAATDVAASKPRERKGRLADDTDGTDPTNAAAADGADGVSWIDETLPARIRASATPRAPADPGGGGRGAGGGSREMEAEEYIDGRLSRLYSQVKDRVAMLERKEEQV